MNFDFEMVPVFGGYNFIPVSDHAKSGSAYVWGIVISKWFPSVDAGQGFYGRVGSFTYLERS